VIAPDSSVLVAGSETGHVHHESAAEALARVMGDGSLLAHTLAETYSTLTGPAYAQDPRNVHAYLQQFGSRPVVWIEPRGYPAALEELSFAGLSGRAIYDGLIAIAAREAGLTLLSLDARAESTYRRLKADFELVP